MSLVVADPDEEALANLRTQLDRLGLDPIPAADLKFASEICEHSPPDLVISGDLDWAERLADMHRRLPVVLAVDRNPERDVLIRTLRCGLADVWTLPAEDDFLRGRVDDILRNNEAAASQAEKRLGQYVATLQRDQRAGRYIQMGMLPPSPMAIDRFRFQHRIVPSLMLSGDFVDYFRLTDRHFVFYIADVSGHGASSAFVTVLLKNFSRRLRREYRPSMLQAPGEILEWFNRELLEQQIDKHVAMILGLGDLEKNVVSLVNAGHFPPAIHVAGQSHAVYVEQRGKPVGLFETVSYPETNVELAEGEALVIFSDGVLDALPDMDLAEKEAALLAAATRAADVDEIWSSLGVQMPIDAADDMTCLLVGRER